MRPLFEKDGFIICFEPKEEHVGMRHHFIKECGWIEKDYRSLRGSAWFSAKVSAWKDGIELGTAYLGCCCYRTAEEFYTTYKDEYFADLVEEAIAEARKHV